MQKMLIAFRDTYPIVAKLSDAGFQFNEDIVDWDIVQKNENDNETTQPSQPSKRRKITAETSKSC